MITQAELEVMLASDNTIVRVLAIRQVKDGWEYLIETNFHFPKFVVGWTNGEQMGFPLRCGREENARNFWDTNKEVVHA